MKRDRSLDAIRGIAALLVLLSHILISATPRYVETIGGVVNIGTAGVALFFLLSGILIPPTLERQGWRVFFVRRFFRLYPLYVVACVVAAFLFLNGRSVAYPTIDLYPPWLVFLAHLTMAPEAFGIPPILGPIWSLAHEMAFYLLLPILPRRYGWIVVVCCILAIATQTLLPFSLATMYLGAVKRPAPWLILLWSGSAIIASPDHTQALGALLGGVFFVLLRRYPIAPGWLTWCGKISYSLYLFHMVVLALIPGTTNVFLTLFIWSGAALLVAALSERLIEQPAMRLRL